MCEVAALIEELLNANDWLPIAGNTFYTLPCFHHHHHHCHHHHHQDHCHRCHLHLHNFKFQCLGVNWCKNLFTFLATLLMLICESQAIQWIVFIFISKISPHSPQNISSGISRYVIHHLALARYFWGKQDLWRKYFRRRRFVVGSIDPLSSRVMFGGGGYALIRNDKQYALQCRSNTHGRIQNTFDWIWNVYINTINKSIREIFLNVAYLNISFETVSERYDTWWDIFNYLKRPSGQLCIVMCYHFRFIVVGDKHCLCLAGVQCSNNNLLRNAMTFNEMQMRNNAAIQKTAMKWMHPMHFIHEEG